MKAKSTALSTVLMLGLGCAYAAPGGVNLSFGSAGVVMTPVPNASVRPGTVVADKAGRLLVAGRGQTSGSPAKSICILARYLPDGQLDTSFGPNRTGVIESYADAAFESGFETVRIDSKNRIVVGGRTPFGKTYTFAIARYLEDGTLDRSFGERGIAHTVFADTVQASVEAIAFDSEDRVIASGVTYKTSGVYSSVLLRYKEHGHLDKNFGDSGIVLLPDVGDYAMSVEVDSKDRVLVAGEGYSGSGMTTFVNRYLEDGAPDTSFGTSGKFSMLFDSWIVHAFALDASDRPIIGRSDSSSGGFTIIRLTKSGALDPTLGGGAGYVTTPIGATPTENLLVSVAIDSGGRILAGGGVSYPGDGALVRYLPSGTLDATFGSGGIAILPTPASASISINTMALDEHHATLAGFANMGGQDELLLAQFNTK